MSTQPVPRRERSIRPVLAGAIALMLVGGLAMYLHGPAAEVIVAPAGVAVAGPAVTAAAPTDAPARGPSFDIVRVTPEGSTVIAGRAEPGSEVFVRDGDRTLGAGKADRNGEFVVVPADRLPAGGRALTLASRGADGADLLGSESLVVIVPERKPADVAAAAGPAESGPKPETAVAVLVPSGGGAPRVLQGAGDRKQGLALNTVDYDERGEIRFSGSAKPSTPVRVYIDNKAAGETITDGSGQWTLTPPASVVPGMHQLRVDQLGGNGRVVRRVELPFQRTATAEGVGRGQAVVQPGQNLWRIARQSYGQGMRYTVIYLANRGQIRDPNLIYPGQVFAMSVSE